MFEILTCVHSERPKEDKDLEAPLKLSFSAVMAERTNLTFF